MRYINLSDSSEAYCYRLSDSDYVADVKIKELEHLSQAFFISAEKTENEPPSTGSVIYDDCQTPIGEKNYQLKVIHNSQGYQLIANDIIYNVLAETIASSTYDGDVTVLLGPVLCLNLALNNIFCLHASAFQIKNTNFILMAESGTGKSTIARYIDSKPNARRIADDILPVKMINNMPCLFPAFPQLKLQQTEQYNGKKVCNDVVLLFASKSNKPTHLMRSESFNSIKKLISHSVAARLFAPHELQKHILFCQQLASACRSYNVEYQHTRESPEKLYGLLYELA